MVHYRWCLLLLLTIGGAPRVAEGATMLVVCPEEFRETLQPWIAYRDSQGHHVKLIDNRGTPQEIRQAIRTEASQHETKFLLLIGDADPRLYSEPAIRNRCVPAHREVAKVNIRWGSEPEIATDNWYADLDDDHVPDLAVGRFTADSPTELATMIRKVLAYERDTNFGRWRQQINFVAGIGGFGALADAALETCAKRFITDGVPPAYHTSMTYGSWRSPYCPDPREFHDTTVARLNEGSLFWVYIGHGHARGLDQLKVPGGRFPILESTHVGKLNCSQGSPIAMFLACYTGAFDAPQDCLAELLLRTEGAPVAVVSGSRVTMPYAMAVLGGEALRECFVNRRETLGELLLHAKRNSVLGPRSDEASKTVDTLAAAINSGADLREERYEHLHLFNLLGDPALRIPHGRPVAILAPPDVVAGEELTVTGACPIDGKCQVELVVRRDRLTFRPASRNEATVIAGWDRYNEDYQKANNPRLHVQQVDVQGGKFAATLAVPADAWGECHVRAFVEGKHDFALGATDIRVTRPVSSPKP